MRALAVAAFLVASCAAVADEIKVLSAGAVRVALQELAPAFERATHHGVAITYGTAGTLRALLAKGASADVVVLPAEGIGEAEERGWVRAGSRRDLAHVGIGVAVRKGAPLPDISTPEALKRALLAASAVAYVDPTRGTSGRHVDSVVLPALGIANEVRTKARLQSEGSAAEFLRRGEADIAIQQISELLAEDGVTVVGPLPAPLQKISTYSAAITTNALATGAARELIEFLSTPASKAVFKAKGMDAEPVP
ncbi:MAG TPA: substrate-binding domain-containing protein [Casimicrobiaceae bacterium]|nr:substrate-binding domain-containing protein [Casimicrobiaceae bacterium]